MGSAFFGWLAATGMAVLLTALVTAGGAAVSLAQGNEADAPTSRPSALTEAVVLLVIFFVAYYCGGYVAGRMARFNGMKQGVAVWIWADRHRHRRGDRRAWSPATSTTSRAS